jgi:hypothetical protein
MKKQGAFGIEKDNFVHLSLLKTNQVNATISTLKRNVRFIEKHANIQESSNVSQNNKYISIFLQL